MAFEITIPRLGWSMEEGTFAGWRKNEGEFVRRGDILFELEGEKALQEIEALDEGILKFVANSPKPGAVLKVGDVIGYLTAADEPVQSNAAAASNAELSASPSAEASEPRDSVAAPSVRRLARELGVAVSNVAGTGPGGRVLEDDVRAAAAVQPSKKRQTMPRRMSVNRDSLQSPRALVEPQLASDSTGHKSPGPARTVVSENAMYSRPRSYVGPRTQQLEILHSGFRFLVDAR